MLEGWLYLASVVDLSTRMAVGRRFSPRMTAGVRVAALEMAKRRGHVAGNAIFRSDRGGRYAGAELAGWAAGNDARPSAGRTGCCRDNAVAESLWASLRNEMYCRATFAAREEAKLACIDWIERHCSRSRPHSAIGRRHPAEVMREFEEGMGRALGAEVYLAA